MPSTLARFWTYQSERFPLLATLSATAAFTFCAASYSRLSRGAEGMIPWPLLFLGFLTSASFFFLLRVLDEHKDRDIDARYRPELPVPRGLVSLAELRLWGGTAMGVTLLANAFYDPRLLAPCLLVALWATLMTKEFFAPDWLRARPALYLVSHMLVMPFIDVYTTGLDWIPAGAAHGALLLFLLVTFFNGVLLEIGRKLKADGAEREGVDTYSKAWGPGPALGVWMATLMASTCTAAWAGVKTGAGAGRLAVLVAAALVVASAGLFYAKGRTPTAAKTVENSAALWTVFIYLWLGAGPWLAAWWAGA